MPEGREHAVTQLVLPHLVYSRGVRRVLALLRLAAALRDAAGLFVVGADIMDGNYNRQASIGRAHVACLASFSGIPASILGFSWSPAPDEAASRELRFAASTGVRLMARDPGSFRRLEESGFSNVLLVADMVFMARSIDDAAASRVLEDIGVGAKPFVLVNASAMVQRRVDQTAAYVKFIRDLQRVGLEVVLLPHVSRSSGDDLDPQGAIEVELDAAEVKAVRALLSPATILGLCARASFVVTGRMHLGVMALLVGVPPVILSTQGKVEGLYEHFEIGRLCVDPSGALKLDLSAEVEYLHSHLDEYRAQIRSRLTVVKSLAELNFELPP
jgi:colanic acid/amylovoran biosynthesis protein